MNGLELITAVRGALIDEDGPGAPAFVSGAVPAGQKLPYLVLSILPSAQQRTATDADEATDGVQVDALAATLADAMGLSDAADGAVLSLGSVAADGSSFGLRRASGSWRTVLPGEPDTGGQRVVRVTALYTETVVRPS